MAAAAPAATQRSYPGIRYCDAGRGIQLAYESFGPVSSRDPPILLVAGLSSQMISWPTGLCDLLTQRTGLRVVRFDNRDVGLSTHLHDRRVSVMKAVQTKDFSQAPYSLADMADDAVALIRHLAAESGLAGTPRAHVVGASMGGMIVQELAIRHPESVASLTSIMSTPDSRVGKSLPEVQGVLVAPPPTDKAEMIQRALETYEVIGSRKYPVSTEWVREVAAEAFERSFDPMGGARQIMAIWSAPSRTERLAAVRAPTLVIHGDSDPLITVEGGRATAAAIPGSTLLVIPDMGHAWPEAVWAQHADAIDALIKRAATASQNEQTRSTSPSAAKL